jgi:phosphocarrier protein FPr/phosphocarrier protein
MSLGVRKGETVTVRASGPDAARAVAVLEVAIRSAVEGPPAHGGSSVNRAAPRSVADNQAVPSGGASFSVVHAGGGSRPVGGASRGSRSADAGSGGDRTFDKNVIQAVIASPGIATGLAYRLIRPEIAVAEAGEGISHERARLESARVQVRADLQAAARSGHGSSRDIAGAHLEFLDDPELVATAGDLIARGKSAGFAWRAALRANAEVLRALQDARMAERVDDLRDLEQQVLAVLQGEPTNHRYALPERAIVIADELLPSQFVALDGPRVAGICIAGGGPTSHVSVLAASVGVPMLVAAGRDVLDIEPGTPLVLDAVNGELRVDPQASQLVAAEEAVARQAARRRADREAASREARTADGTRIEVFANAASVAEATAAMANGAEGCGLLRTEFLFLDRDSAPDEATQAAEYQRIVAAFDGRSVVIRTLDVGGDKPLAYMPLPREENPALGVRGIRVGLQHPELLRSQLRAILKLQPRGVVRVLLPMVSEPAEVHAVRMLLDEARRETGYDHPVPLGAMIETPASAVRADQIARAADFLSIGTNDLTQYTLAMDRGNPALAARLDALHPAVLQLISIAARAGRASKRDVAVCGGLASDPIAAPILIGLGVNELSAVPSVLPRLKALIREVTMEACETLARHALEMESAAEVRALAARWVAVNVNEVPR